MGVSGCTSCQVGGVEALKAYDRAYEVKMKEKEMAMEKQAEAARQRNIYENQPVEGASIGSRINISV